MPHSFGVQIDTIVTGFDLFGTMAFAVSGALLGKRKEYNFWGVLALAFCTAIGGGTLRNVLVNLIPAIFLPNGWMYIFGIVIVSFLVFYGSLYLEFKDERLHHQAEKFLARSDAVGLAIFVMLGAKTAIMVGLPFLGIIVFAVLTGAGGGIIRDVIANEKPYAFKGVHYITWCVIAGGLAGILHFERFLLEPLLGSVIYKAVFALLPTFVLLIFRFREIEREMKLNFKCSKNVPEGNK